MSNSIQILIPKPCHENWQAMTSVEKGRFCISCQKVVVDFSAMSDKTIIESIGKASNLCGRFSNSQLNRELVIRRQKSNLWTATASMVISFLSSVTHQTIAQGSPNIEQTENKNKQNEITPNNSSEQRITGIVFDDANIPLPGATILNKETKANTQTDFDGKFVIKASPCDVLVFSYVGMYTKEMAVPESMNCEIKMGSSVQLGGLEYVYVRKRNFFGKLFQKIKKVFR
jgi:hypothetical protein